MNPIKFYVSFLCAISLLHDRVVTGQNRLVKFAPLLEYMIKQHADTVIESDY